MIARGLVCLPAVLLSGACGSIVDAPARDTPFLYLLLSPSPVTSREIVADSTPWALVASTITPIDARYRSVERFRLRRESDGASYVWRARQLTGKLGTYFGVVIDGGTQANVILTAAGDSGAFGWRSLIEGGTYALDVMSEGVGITGTTTIPARPALEVTEEGTAHIVRWPRAYGAAGYHVRASDDFGPVRISADTAFVWCEHVTPGVPPPRRLRVVALDTNAFRYFGDSTVSAAGVTGALGLFGGANEARLELPGAPMEAGPDCSRVKP